MKTKMATLVVSMSFKADADPTSRTFEGLASTWEQDLGNDVIHKGAFKDTLKQWKAGGDAIPLLNSHDHWNIFSGIGQLVDAKEKDEGLWTKWEVLDGAEGDAVLTRIRPSKTTGKAIVGKMSIGYEPLEFSFEQPEGTESFWDRIRHLTKVALKEVSLVLFPMNPGAAIDQSTVKAFIAATQDTDPRKLSVQTKLELRKLASRIGILLKKDAPKPGESAEDDAEEDEQPPKAAPIESPDDDEEDGTEEGDEQEETDVEDKSKKKEPKEKKEGKAGEEAEPPVKEYVFQEALAQRLQAVTLKHRVAEIGK